MKDWLYASSGLGVSSLCLDINLACLWVLLCSLALALDLYIPHMALGKKSTPSHLAGKVLSLVQLCSFCVVMQEAALVSGSGN